MNILKNLKNLIKENRSISIIIILIILLMIMNLYINSTHISDIETSKQSGNEKWNLVNEILQDYDSRILNLENKMNNINQ